MNIGSGAGASGIFDLDEISRVESRRKYSSVQEQATPSGDTVDISDEARKLFSEMIHKYDKPVTDNGAGKTDAKVETENKADEKDEGAGQGGGAGAGGGSSSSSSADQVENLKKQIQALKSQLMALASQAQREGEGGAAMEKMNTVQAQIASLEAQLNAMESAS